MKKANIGVDELLQNNLDRLIEENEANFQTNLKRARELSENQEIEFTGNHIKKLLKKAVIRIVRPAVSLLLPYQDEWNLLLMNMEQDLKRLQIHMTEKAELSAKIEMANVLKKVNFSLYDKNRKRPCVIQIVSTLNYGDAVGNDVIAIYRALTEEGYLTAVYANSIHVKQKDEDILDIIFLPELREDDIVIYHFSAADSLTDAVKSLPCKVVLRYHNVTPPEFFHDFDSATEHFLEKGLAQVESLAEYVDYGMVDSDFNKQDLRRMGYECPIGVVPILIPFQDYEKKPDEAVLERYSDGRTNIIFVGRGAPNKKIEDVMRCFHAYKKRYDKDARLFLVGNYDLEGKYYAYLQRIIEEENMTDIIFPGHISFSEILAYYRVSNLFMCMSEHEGFCVPLLEAMFFRLPIIAYSSTAVPYTLGEAGILVKEKNPDEIAEKMYRVLTDGAFAKEIQKGQDERLKKFYYAPIKEQIMAFLEGCSEETHSIYGRD